MNRGWGLKNIIAAVVLTVVMCPSSGPAKIIDGVFININGNAVTFSEFREFVARRLGLSEGDAEEYLRKERSKEKLKSLSDFFIDKKLIYFELEKVGDTVDDDDVEEVIQRIVKESRLSGEEFQKALEREGITFQSYRENLREEMEKSRIIRSMKGNEVLVTDAEAKNFYLENRERFKRHYKVNLHLISFPLSLSESNEALILYREALSGADRLVANGGSFDDVEAFLKNKGIEGEVSLTGFVSVDDLSRELVGEVSKLSTGEISSSIITEDRVLFVEIVERSGGEFVPFEEVKNSIREELVGKRSLGAIKEIIRELRSSSYIEVHL